MTDRPLQPSIETLMVGILRGSATLEPAFGTDGERVATKLLPDLGYPFLSLRLIGSFRPVEQWLVGAAVEFAVWGDHGQEQATEDAANLAESVVLGLVGPYDAAVVTGVQPIIGPRNVADPETGRPRYIFESRIFASPRRTVEEEEE